MNTRLLFSIMLFGWVMLFALTILTYTGNNDYLGAAIGTANEVPDHIVFGIFIILLGLIATSGYLLHREYKEINPR